MNILEKIEGLEGKFHEINLLLTDPAVIADQARYTEAKPELCDDDADSLDKSFCELYERLPEQPLVTLTYFVKDKYKQGGCLKDKTGTVRLIDTVNREFIFFDKQTVPLDDVVAIKMNAG